MYVGDMKDKVKASRLELSGVSYAFGDLPVLHQLDLAVAPFHKVNLTGKRRLVQALEGQLLRAHQ